ncbi:MAG: O-antigen ligase family protein [Bacteroidia bacterium]
MKNLLSNDWQYFLMLVLASVVATGINVLPIVMAGLLFWIYTGKYKEVKASFFSAWTLIFILFFVVHVIGIFYSKNIQNAMSLTQTKLGFLLFPLLFGGYHFTQKKTSIILATFCVSNIAIAFFLIVRAVFYVLVLDESIFTYSKFSLFSHPSYASLYFTFSICILFYTDISFCSDPSINRTFKFISSLVLLIAVLFSSSKIGLIMLVFALFFLVWHFMFQLRSIASAAFLFFGVVTTTIVFIIFVPGPLQRLNNFLVVCKDIKQENIISAEELRNHAVTKGLNQKESTMARIFIWNASVDVIKRNWLFGVGTGDVNEALLESFEGNNLYNFLSNDYGGHNQYMETQISVGIPGLVLLLILTFGVFLLACVRKNALLIMLVTLCSMLFGVESALQWQGPAMFFSFFIFLMIEMNSFEKRPATNENAGKG